MLPAYVECVLYIEVNDLSILEFALFLSEELPECLAVIVLCELQNQ